MIEEDDVRDEEDYYVYRLDKGDKLFVNNNKRTNYDKINGYAYTGYKKNSFYGYAIDYKKAADILVQSLKSDPLSRSGDDVTLPIIFLYRHYLELMLKDLEYEGRKTLGEPTIKYQTGHSIKGLWDKLKPIILRLMKAYPIHYTHLEEIEAIEACIKEFATIDANSQSFRYPRDMEGNSSLQKPHLQNIDHIDLDNLSEKMASIDGFLGELGMFIIIYPRSG